MINSATAFASVRQPMPRALTGAPSTFDVRRSMFSVSPIHRRAFSLIEVMIATSLLAVIVIGLLMMFGQTQRAFRAGINQVDVMESGRAALEMIAREVEQAAATGMGGSYNFIAQQSGSVIVQALTGGGDRTNIVEDLLFTTREGQNWQGVGYAVLSTNYIGTLYRYETNASALDPNRVGALTANTFSARPNRVIDGVVHLRYLAYDNEGRLITPVRPYVYDGGANMNLAVQAYDRNSLADLTYEYAFTSNALPAHVEIELGILEAKYVERARNLPPAAQLNYLKNQAGHVQIFRQRVPLRNADATAFQ